MTMGYQENGERVIEGSKSINVRVGALERSTL